MISIALLLSINSLRFVEPNSRIADESHYVTLTKNSLELFNDAGTLVSSVELPKSARPDFQGGVEGPALATDDPDVSIRIEIEGGKLVLQRQSAKVSLTPDQSSFQLRVLNGETEQKRNVRLEPSNTYQRSDPGRMQESMFPRLSKAPLVANVWIPIYYRENFLGTSCYTFVIVNDVARRIVSPIPYTFATYVDDKYILGFAGSYAPVTWMPVNDKSPEALSPFVCRVSDLSVTILKKMTMKTAPHKFGGTTNLDIALVPHTIDPSGTLILCSRVECTKPAKYDDANEHVVEEAQYKYSVVLFRNGQAEVLGKMQVEGQTVTPTRVISAKGTFAILEGTDSKGKTVAFTYHLR